MKTKKLAKEQKGFTLIELLIAIGITGLITWGITMTIFQVFDINTRSTNRMTAISELENAGLWVSEDVQMANYVSTESGLPQLTWNDWDTSDSHAVNYTLEDMSSGEFKILQRSHSVNGGNSTKTQIAEYIDPAETSFIPDPEGGGYIFTVTATVGGESETRIYKVAPRVG